MNTAATYAAGVGVLLSVALAGCGNAASPGQPYCYPDSRCAKVHVVVTRCGGPAPGECRVVPVASVNAFLAGGQAAADGAERAGTGHKLRAFVFLEPTAGRYVFETVVDGDRISRVLTLRLGRTYRVTLIQQAR